MKPENTELCLDARSALLPLVTRCVAVLLLAAGLALFIQHVRNGERETALASEAALAFYRQTPYSGQALPAGDGLPESGGSPHHFELVLAFAPYKELPAGNDMGRAKLIRPAPFMVESGDGSEIFTTLASMDASFAQSLRQRFAEAQKQGLPEPLRFTFFQNFNYFRVSALAYPGSDRAPPGEVFVIENVGQMIGGYTLHALLLLAAGLTAMLLVRESVAAGIGAFDERRKQAMDRVLENERTISNAFWQSESALIIMRLEDGVIVRANASALAFFGASGPEGIDPGLLRDVPAGSAPHRAWLATGSAARLMKLPVGDETFYCTVKCSLIGSGANMQCLAITDVTAMLRLKMESAAHTEYLQRIIDQLPSAMCIKDANLRLLMHNAAFSRIFSRGENMIGRVRHGAVPDDIMDRMLEADRKALASETPISLESEIPCGNGKTRSLIISKRVIRGRNGQPNLLAVCTDVSTLKKTERALIGMRERAEAANVAKNEFLACMSHEMRTPLNVILGMTQLARSANPGPTLDRQLQKISEAATTLLETIAQILDFANSEAGTTSLDIRPFSLNALLAEVEEKAAALPLRPGVRFECRVEQFTSDFMGDPKRIAQVLHNLLCNAAKFTHEGFIRLICRQESTQDIYFAVQDSGIGIPEDRMDRLFTGFGQLEQGHARRYGGSGLGLAITRHFIHLMQGEIGLHSLEDKGSTFFFTLPLQKAERGHKDASGAGKGAAIRRHFAPAPAAAGKNTEHRPLALAGADLKSEETGPVRHKKGDSPERDARVANGLSVPRVLVVDDNAVNLEILCELLASIGLDCDMAEDGQQALNMAGENNYDLVIMDVQMPVMDGLAATRAIRALPGKAGSMPIVALTANALPQDRQNCLEAGMNDFLSKPMDVQQLFETVERWLEREAGSEDEALVV